MKKKLTGCVAKNVIIGTANYALLRKAIDKCNNWYRELCVVA
jgi:hypothetical protein